LSEGCFLQHVRLLERLFKKKKIKGKTYRHNILWYCEVITDRISGVRNLGFEPCECMLEEEKEELINATKIFNNYE
jgi:hypothetical protein